MDKFPSILFLLLLFFPLSWADSHDTFIKCLSNQSNQLSSIVYTPTNPSYTKILQFYIRNRRFNRTTTPKPALIVTPLTELHVSAAVVCAKSAGIHLKIRSGGHDYDGISYVSDAVPFVVLDINNLRMITIDIKSQTAWVQAGATVGELYYKIATTSKARFV